MNPQQLQKAASQLYQLPKVFCLPKSGIPFCLIPPGTGQLGSRPDETGHYEDEAPVQEVRVHAPFYLARFPMRVTDWNALFPEARRSGSPHHPIVDIDWDEAQAVAEHVHRVEGPFRIRLPLEAEWEYACRAGNTEAFGSGISPAALCAASTWPADRPRASIQLTDAGTWPANAWGLHDMHGLVWEWCADGYQAYTPDPVLLPAPPLPSGSNKVCRGGSFRSRGFGCRSASRGGLLRSRRKDSLGFRLAFTPDQTTAGIHPG